MRRQRDGSDSDGRGANLYLWQILRRDGNNGFDNTVAERTWLGGSVGNINVSGETAATGAAQTWLIGPGGSGDIEVESTAIQQQQRQRKLGLTATVGRKRVNS